MPDPVRAAASASLGWICAGRSTKTTHAKPS
jgi:hypothetical protein